jgi:hypothetical protein
MRQTPATTLSRTPNATPHRAICAHRFETAQIGKRFIPDLLVCQDCGQRVRKRVPKAEMNS